MFTTISDPTTQSIFGSLLSALVPDAGSAIDADMSRVRRDQILAETALTGQNTRLKGQEYDRNAGYMAAAQALSDILSGGNLADPATRATIAGIAAQLDPSNMGDIPGYLTGLTTYADPNFANPSDFSNILLGTGVVGSYGDTPTGFAIDQQGQNSRNAADNARALDQTELEQSGQDRRNAADNTRAIEQTNLTNMGSALRSEATDTARAQSAADVAKINADAAMQRLITELTTPRAPGAGTGSGTGYVTPPTVTPDVASDLTAMADAAIRDMFGDVELPPELHAQLIQKVTELYPQTRNANAAVRQAIEAMGFQKQDGWFGDTLTAPAVPSNAPPSVMAAPPAQPTPEGMAPQMYTGPDGGMYYRDPRTGDMIPAGPRIVQ